MNIFRDENGVEFELIRSGLHTHIYRKAGKEYVLTGEAIIGNLGEHEFGRAFWLAPSGVPASEEASVRRDIERAFAILNGKVVFE